MFQADTNPADADATITTTVRLWAQPQKEIKHATWGRLQVTDIKKMYVSESVTWYPNPILCLSQLKHLLTD